MIKKFIGVMFLAAMSLPSMAGIITVPVDVVAIDEEKGIVLHVPTKEQLDYSLEKQKLNNSFQIQLVELTHDEEDAERQFTKDTRSVLERVFGLRNKSHGSCPYRNRK